MKLIMTLGLLATMTPAANIPVLASDCPARIISAIENAHPKAKTLSCNAEQDDGTTIYEVRIRTAAGKTLEMDISPDGKILVTEESIAVSAVPPAVMKALRAKFDDATVTDVDRLTGNDGDVSYEMTFTADGKKHEMTVTEAGLVLDIDDREVGDEDAAGPNDEDRD